MSESGRGTSGNWWKTPPLDLLEKVRQREDQVFLVLTLVIGALTGLAVVAFILLTERLGMRLYPPGSAPWRRLLFPVVGSLGIGYLLYRYFPNARGSGVPQGVTGGSQSATRGGTKHAPDPALEWAPFLRRMVKNCARSWIAAGLQLHMFACSAFRFRAPAP